MSCIVGLTDLAQSLIDVGTNLLNSHSSIEHLLNLLDQTETLLRDVGQDQPLSMQNALIPTKKALVSVSLSNHPDSDVRVSVVSCLHEIMRITAPEAPYGDHQMREIFRLTIEAFDKLADASSRSYKKAVAVLDIVSKVKSCIVMLDLECNDLILEMFQKFLKIIRPNHHRVVFSSMEMILITIIDETDEVSKDLLDILLASVKKENQNVSPMSWSLAEKVLSRCARKLQPYIIKALNSSTTSVDMYSPVVLSISQIVFETPKVNNIVNTKEDEAAETNLERRAVSGDSLEDKMELGQNKSRSKRPARDGIRRANENDKPKNGSNSTLRQSLRQVRSGSADAEPESGIIGKRGRKPNSLMEGYDVSWVSGRRDTLKTSSSKKIKRKASGGEASLRKVAAKKTPLLKETSSATSRALTGSLKRSRVKIDESDLDSDSPSSPRLKKLALCVRDEEPREEESDQESFEQLEAERNIGSPSKKTRSQNGSEKSQETAKKQPDGEVTSSGKRFSARSEAKRNNSKGASLDTPVPQTLKSKRKVSQFGSTQTQLVKESPKSHPTRRQTARKEVSDLNVSGKDLVGKRVNIWWPLDKTYYDGVVDSYCSRRKTHRIMYTDGESERLNLSKERWELLEDLSSDSEHEMEIDLPETIPLSNFIQKQKSKKNKNVAASVEPTSSSGLRSSSRTSMKKNSGKKLNNEVERGKGVSKADSVSKEPKKTNLKSLKELNAESDRAEEQEVSQELDHESEGDDCSEKQEQSENNDSEAETKEEEKQDPNSEVESEGEGSESEDEPKWRETDDMEDEAEEEREEGDDDKGTRTDDIEDETDEEIEEDKGTRTKNMEDEDEDTRTEDMEDEAEEESDDDKGTGTKDMENEAEERGEEDKGTRTEDMEGEAEEEGEENKGTMAEDVEDEAEEEKEESDDDKGKTTEDMEDKAEVEEGDDDKGTRTKDMENEADKEKEEGNDDKGTSLEKEKEEDEEERK